MIYSEEKLYTQEDFDKKLSEAVNKQVDLIKKKSVSQLSKELLAKDRELEAKAEQLKIREEAQAVALHKQFYSNANKS